MTKSNAATKNTTTSKKTEQVVLETNVSSNDKTLTLADHAKKYTAIVTASKTKLKTLEAIGNALILIRIDHKLISDTGVVTYNNKGFNAAIKETPLKVMTAHDRGDAIWLSENSEMISNFKAKKGLESQSVTYLRKAIRKAEKAAIQAAKDIAEAEAHGINDKMPKPKGQTKGKAGDNIETKKDIPLTDVELVTMFMELCKANDVDAKRVATMLTNAAKTA